MPAATARHIVRARQPTALAGVATALMALACGSAAPAPTETPPATAPAAAQPSTPMAASPAKRAWEPAPAGTALPADLKPYPTGDTEVFSPIPTETHICGYRDPEPVPPARDQALVAEATTALSPADRYGAQNAVDGALDTAWVEGDAGLGVGARLVVRPKPGELIEWPTGIEIVPGYAKSDATWTENARPMRIGITAWHARWQDYTEPMRMTVTVPAGLEPGAAIYVWTECACYTEMTCESDFDRFDFEILDVAKGTKFDDTAISEIRFH